MQPSIEKHLTQIFARHELPDYRPIDPAEIVLAEWVRMKCRYGCSYYGKHAACPPNNPPVATCRELVAGYRRAVVFRFARRLADPEERHDWTRGINWSLHAMEREVFLSGLYKALVLFVDPCNFCDDCAATRAECQHPKRARPSPEGLGIDVFETVRRAGYPIEVLPDYDAEMNRYAILLLD
jgi:predicted metal-binding protein